MNAIKIKKLRKKLGINTADFGARVGVSGRTVEDWEQGRRTPNQSAVLLLGQIAATSRSKRARTRT